MSEKNMNICSHKHCEEEVYRNDKCIFHCEKDEFNNEDIAKFWIKIKEKKMKNEDYDFSYFIFPEFDEFGFWNEIEKKLNHFVNFTNAIFTKNIIFYNMHFFDEVFFDNVTIKEKITFKKCTFNKKINFIRGKINKISFEEINLIFDTSGIIQEYENFKDCGISFFETNFLKDGEINFKYVDLNHLSFENCNLPQDNDYMFKIYNSNIFQNLQIIDTNLGHCQINDLNLSKTNFSFYNTSFKNVYFNNTYWGNLNLKRFESYSRDTFRELKYINENQNNFIDANKFYALEMEAYSKELSFTKHPFEWIILRTHKIISNYSQNWLLALFWFFLVGIIFTAWGLHLKGEEIILSNFHNEFAKMVNPLNFLKSNEYYKCIEAFALIFKTILLFILYQFIISIRRNTRRK